MNAGISVTSPVLPACHGWAATYDGAVKAAQDALIPYLQMQPQHSDPISEEKSPASLGSWIHVFFRSDGSSADSYHNSRDGDMHCNYFKPWPIRPKSKDRFFRPQSRDGWIRPATAKPTSQIEGGT